MGASEAVLFHRIFSNEQNEVSAHLLRLGPEDRALRFAGFTTDAGIMRYVERIDWSRSVLVGAYLKGQLRGLAELKAMPASEGAWGEAALSIERPCQDRGIGTRLFRNLVVLAANRGMRELFVVITPDNRRMRRILLHYQVEFERYDGEVEGRVRMPWPSGLTYAQEFMDAWLAGGSALLGRPPAPMQLARAA